MIFQEPGTFSTPRNPAQLQQRICQASQRLGFAGFAFHISAAPMRLCSSIGACRCLWVHVVAERIGDDPAVLLRNDAARKHQRKANTDFSALISALAAGFLGK